MFKIKDILKKIAMNPNLMVEFKKSQSFEGLCELCKKVEPSITEAEVKEGIQELVIKNPKNNVSPLNNEELATVAGGSMDFNKTKALALSALMLTGVSSMTMLSNNAYASGTPETANISQQAEVRVQDQNILDKAFSKAVISGDKTAVEECLNKGVNANTKVNGVLAALISAANDGSIDIIKLLLDRGADIEINDKGFGTALTIAAYKNQSEVINLLLSEGANINATNIRGLTALMFAAKEGHTDIISLLLDRGIDINAKDDNGKMAINYAAENGNKNAVKLLLDRGATVDALSLKQLMEQSQKISAEKEFLKAATEGIKEKIEELLNKGTNINAQGDRGKTALMFAAENGHIDVVKLLLSKGADVNLQGNSMITALRLASENGHVEIVKLLLDKSEKIYRESALYYAIEHSQVDVVRLLLEKGENANKKDFWTSHNILMKATWIGNADIVKLLLAHGASVYAKDNSGKSALDYARTDEIKEILKEAAKNTGFFEKATEKVKNLL